MGVFNRIGSSAWAEAGLLRTPRIRQSYFNVAFRNLQPSLSPLPIMASQQPPYVAIAQRKQNELAASIPSEWQLPTELIPEGMLSPADSVTEGPKRYGRVNVMKIPRTCGILTSKELDITENYDVRGLVSAMTEGQLKSEEVTRAFCKVRIRDKCS